MAMSHPRSPSQSLPDRLVELLALENGWLDGEGEAYEPAQIKWLADSWTTHADGVIPTPYTYPHIEGGIQMEWPLDNAEVVVRIDLSERSAEFYNMDYIRSELVDERQFSLSDETEWAEFVDYLKSAVT